MGRDGLTGGAAAASSGRRAVIAAGMMESWPGDDETGEANDRGLPAVVLAGCLIGSSVRLVRGCGLLLGREPVFLMAMG